MDSIQQIKLRLRSVKNIGQITKAMERVAAVKMRKSQQIALRTRPYAFKALELLEKLSFFVSFDNKLIKARPVKNILAVVIASDHGLAGSFNNQVFRLVEKTIEKDKIYVAVGKKAESFILKKGLKLVKGFHGFGDFVEPEDIDPLFQFIIDGFEKGDWDRVITISMHFRTALRQEPLVRQILPLDFEKIRETINAIVPEYGKYADQKQNAAYKDNNLKIDYLFEPSPEELLEKILIHLLRTQVYHLVLEANASEHSARRLAMKNASDNAKELSEQLLLQFNKARQALITKEMIEISSTQSALSHK